jgi:hypothetical protein
MLDGLLLPPQAASAVGSVVESLPQQTAERVLLEFWLPVRMAVLASHRHDSCPHPSFHT